MGRVPDVLGLLERERCSGVLRVGGEGAFHIRRGFVTGVESRHAPGPDGPEPEVAALLATFDAAYFLLDSEDEPVFTEKAVGGSSTEFTVATLVHEQRRRRGLLDAAWPDAGVDTAPVEPVRRVRRQRVILTGLQAEILLNADGTRTPAHLARDLGRTAFACLLAVRGLAAASLLRVEAPGDGRPDTRRPASGRPSAGPSGDGRTGIEIPGRAEAPAEWAPPDHAVLTRLRAALVELG